MLVNFCVNVHDDICNLLDDEGLYSLSFEENATSLRSAQRCDKTIALL